MAEAAPSDHGLAAPAEEIVAVPFTEYAKMSDAEQESLALLRKHIRESEEVKELPSLDASDMTLLRFLRARGNAVQPAFALLLKSQRWYQATHAQDLRPEHIAREYNTRKAFIAGHDRGGHPILWCFLQRHIVAERDLEETEGLVIWALEEAIRRMPEGCEQVLFVYDRSNSGWANTDKAILGRLASVQDNYPERLHRLVVLRTNFIYWLMFKL